MPKDSMSSKHDIAQQADISFLEAHMKPRRVQRIRQVAESRQRGLAIIMEDVWNPHNLAAIARSADAFGIQHIHYTTAENYFDPTQIGKASSSGANKWIDFHYHEDIADCIEALQREGWFVAATVMTPEARSIYDVDWPQYERVAVLMGNEHDGLSARAIDKADMHIIIPMRGMVQSFNVSVATAITIAEITRQRDISEKDFRLPEAEAQVLYETFIRKAY